MKILLAILFLVIGVYSQGLYTKKVVDADPNAKCLDGSPPLFYYHQGAAPSNILFFLEGANTCVRDTKEESLKACYERSLSYWGSSKYWPNSYDATGLGILQTNSFKNFYANWTKVLVIYCDGALFQGNNVNPVPYNGKNLYFRGAVNMRAIFKEADKLFSLNKASRIVLAGSASGGMATFLWIDYLRSLVNNPTLVSGIADSAILLDPSSMGAFASYTNSLMPFFTQSAPNGIITNPSANSGGIIKISPESTSSNTLAPPPELYIKSIVDFMSISNANERPPNKKCVQSLVGTGEDWKCLFAGYASKYLDTKLLWLQSQYDKYVIKDVLQSGCIEDTASGSTLKKCSSPQILLYDFYRSIISTQIVPLLIQQGHSVWSNACSWDQSLDDSTIYYSTTQIVGNIQKLKDMVEYWGYYTQSQRKVYVWDDKLPWPSNQNCAY